VFIIPQSPSTLSVATSYLTRCRRFLEIWNWGWFAFFSPISYSNSASDSQQRSPHILDLQRRQPQSCSLHSLLPNCSTWPSVTPRDAPASRCHYSHRRWICQRHRLHKLTWCIPRRHRTHTPRLFGGVVVQPQYVENRTYEHQLKCRPGTWRIPYDVHTEVTRRNQFANVAFRKLWTVWLMRSHITQQFLQILRRTRVDIQHGFVGSNQDGPGSPEWKPLAPMCVHILRFPRDATTQRAIDHNVADSGVKHSEADRGGRCRRC